MNRFYVNLELDISQEIDLPIEVVRHINVLRLRSTEHIELFNGDGFNYVAKFITLEKRSSLVFIENKCKADNESPVKITLLMALIANDKFDLVVQKAVELGVNKIIPVITQNTQRNFNQDKLDSKIEHWQKIIISASEQCQRASLMEIEMPQSFINVMDAVKIINNKFILSPHHAGKINSIDNVDEVVLCVGPEGGFIDSEVDYANSHGFKSVLLGKRIMRAETAAISSISVLQNIFGDF